MATNKKTEANENAKINDENTLVEIELFRDNKDYKDNVFVAVNGESCVIARGRKVKIEKKFARIIWNNEPLSSGELVKLCEQELSWKKQIKRQNCCWQMIFMYSW